MIGTNCHLNQIREIRELASFKRACDILGHIFTWLVSYYYIIVNYVCS